MSGSNTEDLLAGRSGLNGLSSISLTVTREGIKLSSIPASAQYALIVVEGFSLSDVEKQLCCRWAEHRDASIDISDTIGFPVGHLGMIELRGKESLQNFAIKTLSTVLSADPVIKVGYYE